MTIPTTTLLIIIGVYVVAKIVVNLTPTQKDNQILTFIEKIVDAIIPNVKKDEKGKIKLHSWNIFKSIWKLFK